MSLQANLKIPVQGKTPYFTFAAKYSVVKIVLDCRGVGENRG